MLLDLFAWRSYAPSGMRRLMMYQLQEESLRADEERKKLKQVVTEAVAKSDVPESPRTENKAPAKKRRVVSSPEIAPEPLPPFKRAPILRTPDERLPEVLWMLRTEIYAQYVTTYPVLVTLQQNRVKIQQQVAAANDADYRLRLLLLAA